jgi:succinoglycan biosynthesis transport protein ExoP
MKENQFDPLGQEPFADDEIDLSRWIQAFRRYWRLLAAITVAAIAVSVVKYVISPRLYRSTCTIQIERRTTGVVSVEDIFGGETFWDSQTFYPTQYKILESRGLAERVVKVLDLDQHPVFNPASALTDEAGDGAIEADSDLLLAGLANRLRGGLSIEPIRDTRMVSVSYTSTDPELAARIANGVAEEYINWGIENRSTTVSRAASFLDSQIEQIKREIQDKENQLQAYSRTTDIVALDPNSNVVIQRLRTLNENYTASVSNRIDKEAAYKGLLDAPEETVADTYSGGLVTDLRRKQLELEQEYATNLETYKPEWPQMKELEAKITTGRTNLQSVIDEMAAEARKKARAEYQTALRREQSLAQELTQQKAEAMKVNSNAVEYRNLQVEIDTRRSLLDQLLRKQSDTGVADRLQGTRNSNVVVVDRALVPGGPFRPNLPRNVALGLVIGLFLGAGAVVLLELLDRTLRTPEDAERILNLPVLGVIPMSLKVPRRVTGTAMAMEESAGVQSVVSFRTEEPLTERGPMAGTSSCCPTVARAWPLLKRIEGCGRHSCFQRPAVSAPLWSPRRPPEKARHRPHRIWPSSSVSLAGRFWWSTPIFVGPESTKYSGSPTDRASYRCLPRASIRRA